MRLLNKISLKLNISNFELKKFLLLFGLLFFVFFNYVILRVTKDAFILNASKDGAKAIPFIKIWMVTPIAFLLMVLEIKLINIYNRFKVFVINLIGFTLFYLLFFYVLFPNVHEIAPHSLINLMNTYLPLSFSPFVTMIEYWPISLFYVLSEMWASIVISLLVWGFANSVSSLKSAKNLYGYLGVGTNVAYFSAGTIMTYFISHYLVKSSLGGSSAGGDADVKTFTIFISIFITFSSFMAGYIFYKIEKMLLVKEMENIDTPELKTVKSNVTQKLKTKNKSHMGAMESLLYVFKSRYLRHLAFTVVGYGVTINILEVVWKNQVRKYFPTTIETLNFMALLQIYLSFIAVTFQISSSYLLKKWGWGKSAMICPAIILSTGVFFFSFVLMPNLPWSIPFLAGATPLALSVWIGAWQNVLSKGTKNSIYNVCKEIAFIPLDDEIRTKGKAAIDVLGERFGKFGGSLLSMLMIMFFTSPEMMIIGSMVVLVIFSVQWLASTKIVSNEFQKYEDEKEVDDIDPKIEFKSSPRESEVHTISNI